MTAWYEKKYPKNPNPPNITLPRTLYAPAHNEGFYSGDDVVAYKRAVSRLGRYPWDMVDEGDGYNDNFALGFGGNVKETGVKGVQRQSGLDQSGVFGPNTFNILKNALIPAELPNGGQPAFDSYALNLLKNYSPGGGSVPDLGPVCKNGKPLTDQDLTHATSGLPLYPAFDDGFQAGASVLAPEAIVITRASSSNPGDACYAEGDSGLDYWFGHLDVAPAVGKSFKKGATIGYVMNQTTSGGTSHVHTGVNVERIWGSGKEMSHHTNYTHGAPTVGSQLAAGHAL